MKLTRLVITDFGPYAGQNEFNLRTTSDRPIVLIGGKNGAGKTTLFTSIQIALHGRSALGQQVSEREYKSIIRNRLHSSGEDTAKSALVRLEFEYGDLGSTHDYVIERKWRDRGKSIVEELNIRRDGQKLGELGEDQWGSFLKELIPPGVSQLFFFDGEQVQELAASMQDSDGFEESIHSLLGLDLLERLDGDISIYLSHKLDQSKATALSDKIQELRAEKAELDDKFQQRARDLAGRQNRISELTKQINEYEERLAQEGGGFAQKRSELKEQRSQLDDEINRLEESIRVMLEGNYPFVLAPELSKSVQDRLRDENDERMKRAAHGRALDDIESLADDRTVWDEFDLTEDEIAILLTNIKSSLDSQLSPDEDSSRQLSVFFSEQQQDHINNIVDQTLSSVPIRLGNLSNELETATRNRQEIQQQINRAPDENVIQPILDQISELTETRGQLKAELSSIKSDIDRLKTLRNRLDNQIENKIDQRVEAESVSDRAQIATKTQKIVREYRQALTEKKLNRLEAVLSRRYSELSNKDESHESISIDTETMKFSVLTSAGNRKLQSELSAGERQIFATALLWSLAQISDRPLPFIIDTPLGRLDKDHRQNIVENFFPTAAHQVIILSTDTEVIGEYYDAISDSICHEYHLDYRQSQERTVVTEGYFTEPGSSALEDNRQMGLSEVSDD